MRMNRLVQRWIESSNRERPEESPKEFLLPEGEGQDEGEPGSITERRVISSSARTGSFRFLPFALVTLLLAATARAATNDLTTLLQRGLFEEEANRNLDAAISNYQSLANDFDKDRQLAATAIFRLGECYRKLGRTNEAVAQYQRIVREFSDQQTLATLSQQNLAGLGVNQRMSDVLSRLMQQREAEAGEQTAYPSVGSDSLHQLQSALTKEKTDYDQKETLLDRLKNLSRDELKKALPTIVLDNQLNTFLSELDLAEQNLLKLKADYSQDHPKYVSAKESVDDLNRKINDRIDGILAGLQAQLDASKAHQDWIQKRIELAGQSGGTQTAAEQQPPITDEEEKEIRRIQAMIQNSPDLINAGSAGPNHDWTPLYQAADSGWLRVATYLLDHGADVNLISRFPGEAPLFAAARTGNRAMVEFLLGRGADINGKSHGRTPLHVAAEKGFLAVTETLLNHKADVNAPNDNGQTPLHLAAANGRVEIIKLLLADGAEINAKDNDGETPLGHATANGSVDITKSLLAAKADPNGGTTNLPLAAVIAFAPGNKTNICDMLLRAGADPNKVAPVKAPHWDPFSTSPMQLAINRGETDTVKLLLGYKGDANAIVRPETGETALMHAASSDGNTEIAKALLAHGANVDATDSSGQTALFYAIKKGDSELTELLISDSADLNLQDKGGNTALHYAAESKNPALVQLLVSSKADVNAQNKDGKTPLALAREQETRQGPPPFAVRLARLGATPGTTTIPNTAESPSSGTNIIALLREHGALDELPNLNAIRVTRAGIPAPAIAFERQSNDWNHYTLLETVLSVYSSHNLQVGYSWYASAGDSLLAFPDLTRIIIHRPDRTLVGKQQEIKVNLLNATNAIDCARDTALEFGDMIEIPVRDHALNETPVGLTDSQTHAMAECLKLKVQLSVRGQSRELAPYPTSAFLYSTLQMPDAKSLLLSSSDLTRVKVTRKNRATGKTQIFVVDATKDNGWQDLRLENGDAIEVPDKPE